MVTSHMIPENSQTVSMGVKELRPNRKMPLKVKFILFVVGIVALSISALFYWMVRQSEQAIMDQVDSQARSLLQQIVMMRQWAADQGGLYVKKGPGIGTNPFLPNSDIHGRDGKEYALRNPAMITRQLSEYSLKNKDYRFHITSLKLRNPANEPDEFEKKSLLAFNTIGFDLSRDGVSCIEHEKGKPVYRRIIPLRIEKSCLNCHSDQGYAIGDVRGGISVTIPLDEAMLSIRKNRAMLIPSGMAILLLVSGGLFIIVRRLVLRPVEHLREVAERIEAGRFDIRAEIKSNDEFQDLACSINKMSGRISRGYEAAVQSLAAAIEARDPYTKGHTDRVARYTFAIARQLGWTQEMINEWRMGVFLHDIGKIGIRDSVLQKKGPLDEEEWEEMKAHPQKGADIAFASDLLIRELPAILYHHERFDGKGYPAGLKGKDIPMIARIIAVADVYDALTTDRPYRKAFTEEDALTQILKDSGTQFDPEVVAAFLKAWSEGLSKDGIQWENEDSPSVENPDTPFSSQRICC